jgi:hypothetical protein
VISFLPVIFLKAQEGLFTNVLTRKCGIFYREENAHPMIQRFVALIGERIAQTHL